MDLYFQDVPRSFFRVPYDPEADVIVTAPFMLLYCFSKLVKLNSVVVLPCWLSRSSDLNRVSAVGVLCDGDIRPVAAVAAIVVSTLVRAFVREVVVDCIVLILVVTVKGVVAIRRAIGQTGLSR